MVREFKLAKYPVGKNFSPIFFAEIGSYFNGDEELAKKLMGQIIEVRNKYLNYPMVLKTEILNNPEICLPGDIEETYTNKKGEIKKENYRALIERKAMALEKYEELFSYLRQEEMPFVVSVYDFEAAKFSIEQGACALKIASANIVHIPLIRYAASFGLPLVIDTGRANLAEVFNAVETARQAGCEEIIIQHSPDGHPALPQAHNLRLLQTYEQCFNLPTGLSDHHVGLEMLYVSIALGACVIEKGIYDKPEELDQDISHSMSIHDLEQVLKSVNDCHLALGSSERRTNAKISGVLGTSQRQCLVAKKDLTPGESLSLDNVRFAFPCEGIPVEKWDLVNKWKVKEPISADHPIDWGGVVKEDVT